MTFITSNKYTFDQVLIKDLQQENASLKQQISTLEEEVTQHTVDEDRIRGLEAKLAAVVIDLRVTRRKPLLTLNMSD